MDFSDLDLFDDDDGSDDLFFYPQGAANLSSLAQHGNMPSNGVLEYPVQNCQLRPSELLMNTTNVIVANTTNIAMSPSMFILRPDPLDSGGLSVVSSNGDRSGGGITKQEPDSQPGTPRVPDRRMVPACAICETDSTGIHFGVDACAACSAFFRRTVVLNKIYGCSKENEPEPCNVIKDGSGGQKCRACRFNKCIMVGMDRNAVQHRRDAIGKYAAGVKREYSPTPSEQNVPDAAKTWSPTPSTSKAPRVSSTPASGGGASLLDELVERHSVLTQKRRIFYANRSCQQLFDAGEMEVVELSDYEECMYQLWRIEPRLAAEYISCNRFLTAIPSQEKVKLFRNFIVQRQAVEEPYITWKCGGLDKNWWIMANRTYIDIDAADKYWREGVLKNVKLNYGDAKNLFESSFKNAMTTIGEAMRSISLTETEMIVLCGIALLDPTVATLTKETKTILWGLREQLVREVFSFYEADNRNEEPELRLANLFMILAAVKVHAIKTSENMHLLNTFELIAKDKMFEDICRGNVYDDEKNPQL